MYGREGVFKYCAELFSAAPVHPWDKYLDYAVIKHPGDGKWFAVVMNIPRSKLENGMEGDVDIVNLKIRPSDSLDLMSHEGIYPAWHMNKKLWISVVLDGSVPQKEIEKLIDDSFILTLSAKELRSLKK